MRPKLIALIGCVASVALALALNALIPQPVRAITFNNPNPTTLEGEPICSGPPTTNNLLSFNGTQWCDAANQTITYPNSFIAAYLSTGNGAQLSQILQASSPSVAGHMVELTAQVGSNSSGCSTQLQICAKISGQSCAANGALTLQAQGSYDTSGLNTAFAANSTLQIIVAQNDVGCTTHVQGINLLLRLATP